MEDPEVVEKKLALLCQRLGKMWSEKTITNVEKAVTASKAKHSKFTLIGQLFNNPKINFQAFQFTMKKAWRLENVDFTPLEQGVFAVTFDSERAKNRVLEQGPWSFSNHLLILKQWQPNTTALCYKFNTCDFWVHILGIPFEWGSSELVREAASIIGVVKEAKMEIRGTESYGKARVVLDLSSPLPSGTLANNGGEKTWLDFKYERLPYFCFSCGRIGHYAAHCEEVPYKEEDFETDEKMIFGAWLKVEVSRRSPFWRLLHGGDPVRTMEEEVVPETPVNSGQLVVYGQEIDSTDKETNLAVSDKGKGKMVEGDSSGGGGAKLQCFQTMMNTDEQFAEFPEFDLNPGPKKKKKQLAAKVKAGKRSYRFSPYKNMDSTLLLLDDENLLETPVIHADGSAEWALVASPNKPPGSK